jgi:hypothetical protein
MATAVRGDGAHAHARKHANAERECYCCFQLNTELYEVKSELESATEII